MELDQKPLREQGKGDGAERRLEGRSGVPLPSIRLVRTEQEKGAQSKNNKKMKLSWFPAAVLFLCLLVVTTGAALSNSDTSQLLSVDVLARVGNSLGVQRPGSNLVEPHSEPV